MRIGLIGNGSWATALAKILTDNNHEVHWWMRSETSVAHLKTKKHNKDYLSSVYFHQNIFPTTDAIEVVEQNEIILFCTPSAYITDVLHQIPNDKLANKICISAIKGIILSENVLLNEYLIKHYKIKSENYVAITGPCHAEEVAQERLSYLTFSGSSEDNTAKISKLFNNCYINTTLNKDIFGTQYAAILKNIYAIGAGIGIGLGYGDNFLSVFATNCYKEMHSFLTQINPHEDTNYISSAYLGDLLVTCFSAHSRNRTFGTLVGKGYFAKNADSAMNMVAEGYFAIDGLYKILQDKQIYLPIVDAIYKILKEGYLPQEEFELLQESFI
jgi:glycerol-3-phosphate dehydrogenase (NAD(P)+)